MHDEDSNVDSKLKASNDQLETIVLRPSAPKWILIAFGCAVFVLIGIPMVREGHPWGWPCIAFFGLGFLVALLRLIPGLNQMTLSTVGFTIRTFGRNVFVAWRDIDRFYIWTFRNHGSTTRMVAYDYVPGSAQSRSYWRRFSRAFTGAENRVGDTYGLSVDELLDLMNRYLNHDRARRDRTEDQLSRYTNQR